MTLTLEEVEHIAALARLELSPGEKELFRRQLSAILAYAAQVQSVDSPASDSPPPDSPVAPALFHAAPEDADAIGDSTPASDSPPQDSLVAPALFHAAPEDADAIGDSTPASDSPPPDSPSPALPVAPALFHAAQTTPSGDGDSTPPPESPAGFAAPSPDGGVTAPPESPAGFATPSPAASLRPDHPLPSLPRADLLANAPNTLNGQFRVPPALE